MGSGTEWKCNSCGYEVITSGPWEFYRDATGQRKPYGHPVPISDEARQAGMKGFSVKWYCPDCRTVQDVILIEYKEPVAHYEKWKGFGQSSESAPECPKCGAELKRMLKGHVCPRCTDGKFEYSSWWIA